jgi:large subunit ribosomal protein L23
VVVKNAVHDILLHPLITEKITALREAGNKFGFLVCSDANRIEVKRAVESALKVKVDKVNIMNVMGKRKRFGRFSGRRPDWKKAIVTLRKGEKLEIYEGV